MNWGFLLLKLLTYIVSKASWWCSQLLLFVDRLFTCVFALNFQICWSVWARYISRFVNSIAIGTFCHVHRFANVSFVLTGAIGTSCLDWTPFLAVSKHLAVSALDNLIFYLSLMLPFDNCTEEAIMVSLKIAQLKRSVLEVNDVKSVNKSMICFCNHSDVRTFQSTRDQFSFHLRSRFTIQSKDNGFKHAVRFLVMGEELTLILLQNCLYSSI